MNEGIVEPIVSKLVDNIVTSLKEEVEETSKIVASIEDRIKNVADQSYLEEVERVISGVESGLLARISNVEDTVKEAGTDASDLIPVVSQMVADAITSVKVDTLNNTQAINSLESEIVRQKNYFESQIGRSIADINDLKTWTRS